MRRAVTSAAATVISIAEFVNDRSIPPIWIGISRSISNCSRGLSSIAKSVLVLVPFFGRPGRARLGFAALRQTDRAADPGDRAVDIQHAGGDPDKKQHQNPPGLRPEHLVDRPAEPGSHHHGDDQLDADAQAEGKPLLQVRRAAPAGPAACLRSFWGAQPTSSVPGRPGRNGAHHSGAAAPLSTRRPTELGWRYISIFSLLVDEIRSSPRSSQR